MAKEPGAGTPPALRGARRALGVPALVLGSSYLGFGALVRQAGLTLDQGLFSTLITYALPGQVAFVELYAVGASLFAMGLAVALTNARLLPMTVALMPYLRAPGHARISYYLAAHLIAVTGWAAAMRDCPHMPPPERLPYFVGFALVIITSGMIGTAGGYLLAGTLPVYVTIGLVFLNPIYFMLVFAADARSRARALALLFGALVGPALYLATPEWSLLLTGLLAGSAAFWLGRGKGGGRAK